MVTVKVKKRLCDCVSRINTALSKDPRTQNTVLATELHIDFKTGKTRELLRIATAKRDPGLRAKARAVLPTYCPFCGKKYAH